MYVRLPHSIGPTQGPHLPYNRGPPEDEYAGLMTNNEKQWLVSIQLVQLSTSTPFQDDYYFIVS
jgi:DNA topoisomerase 2-associated protein PAT1